MSGLSANFCDGWIAHMNGWDANPYNPTIQGFSHLEWRAGHRAREHMLPDDAYRQVIDQDVMAEPYEWNNRQEPGRSLPANRREIMPHTEHDFEAAYGPVLKNFVDGMAGAVQHLLMKTHDAQKAHGASQAVLNEITHSIDEYKKWHGKRFP